MTGGDDPDCRRGMLWDEKRQDAEMYDWYRKLIGIRKSYPVITEGRVVLCECEDENGVIKLERTLGDEKVELMLGIKECKVEVKVEKSGVVLCEETL